MIFTSILRRVSLLLFLFVMALLTVAVGLPVRAQMQSQMRSHYQAGHSSVEIVKGLTITPKNPSIGEAVTAQFTIRNTGKHAITFAQIGAGGRGPDCADWDCPNNADFPLREWVKVAPGATYAYSAERTFLDQGTYFAEIVYQTSDGTWFFDGKRAHYAVVGGLSVSAELTLNPSTPQPNQIVYATFRVQNKSNRTITIPQLGVGVRGPACKPYNWACGDIHEFDYIQNVSIGPGKTWEYSAQRTFTQKGEHFAQITFQDSKGTWQRIGEPLHFSVTNQKREPRTSPWKFAVHYHPVWNETDADRLSLASNAGVDMIRISVPWRFVEPAGKGQWDTAWFLPALENVVDSAENLGLEVYFVIHETPCWASSDPGKNCAANKWNTAYPPNNPGDYAAMLFKMQELFGDDIAAWEIWNEPNDPRFWQPAPDAAAYTQLLRTAYNTLKGIDPTTTVLGGALAGADLDYLDAMLAAGAKNHYDAFSIHPYAGTLAPDACPNVRSSYRCGVDGVLAQLQFHGDDSPVWLTEFGWSSYTGQGGVGEGNQSAYLQMALDDMRYWENVAVATWYNLIDTNSSTGALEFEDHMGLYRGNLQAKPAAWWLQNTHLNNHLYLPNVSSEQ